MTMPSSRVVVYITAIGWHCRKKQRNRHIPLSLSVTRPSCDSCDYRERGRRNKIDAANEVKCSDFDSTDRKGKPGGVPPILMVQIYQRIDDDWTILTTTSQRSNKSVINENKSMRKDGKRLWIDGARTSDPPLSAFTNTDRYLHLWVEIVVGGHGTIQTCSNATALVQFSVE